MSEIEWKEPPPAKTGSAASRRIRNICAELDAHPGQWALVGRYAAPSMATSWRKLGYESTSRKVDGGFDIYVRAAS